MRGCDQGQERSAERAIGQPDHESNREHRSQLDEWQRVFDLLELGEPRRAGARDAREVLAFAALGVIVRERDLGGQAHVWREEEVRNGGRSVLLRARENLLRVQDRKREANLVAAPFLGRGVDGSLDDRLLRRPPRSRSGRVRRPPCRP